MLRNALVTTVVQAQILLIENTGAATGRKSGKLTVRVGNPAVANMSPVRHLPPVKPKLLCPRPVKLNAHAPSRSLQGAGLLRIRRPPFTARRQAKMHTTVPIFSRSHIQNVSEEIAPPAHYSNRRATRRFAASWQCPFSCNRTADFGFPVGTHGFLDAGVGAVRHHACNQRNLPRT